MALFAPVTPSVVITNGVNPTTLTVTLILSQAVFNRPSSATDGFPFSPVLGVAVQTI